MAPKMMILSSSTNDDAEETANVPGYRRFWRTGFLLATSAALGGIAVAVWNRRILAQMRQQPPSDD